MTAMFHLQIDPADLDALIEEQWGFATESFNEEFRTGDRLEGFRLIVEEPLERLAHLTAHPTTLQLLAESFDLVRQAARVGLALTEARERELVATGGAA